MGKEAVSSGPGGTLVSVHWEIFIFASIVYLVSSAVWWVSAMSAAKNQLSEETRHRLNVSAAIGFVVGSIAFIAMPFVSHDLQLKRMKATKQIQAT